MTYLYSADDVGAKLPQKHPLLMLDRVVAFTPGSDIVCLKNVTQNEEYFVGHFPGRKIMPGVLVCEALAQTCAMYGILEQEGSASDPRAVGPAEPGMLTAINVKFVRPVLPGDQLLLRARPARTVEGMRVFEVEATVDREPVCTGNVKVSGRERGRA
jgi:3-hydroxyacyl-[acyl-carrier-protein] dehydratase